MAMLLSASLLSSAPVLAEPPAPSQARSDLDTHVLRQVEAYTQALLDRDTPQVSRLLSSKKRERIQKKYPTSALARFVDTDRANLIGAIGEVDSVRGRFSLLRLETTPDGVSALLAFDGRALPKPLSFVHENGAYQFDGSPNSLSGDDYSIENSSGSTRTVGCYVSRWANISAKTSTYMYCDDEPNFCGNSGTRFTYNNAYHYCDYNTWGVDFFIYSDGTGQCNDRC
jgi:hypothetical protein